MCLVCPVLTVCLVCHVLTVCLPCTDSVFGLPCTDSVFGLSDRSLPHCIDPDKEVTAAPAQTTAPVCPEPGTAAPLSPLDHKACECAVSYCPSPTCGGSQCLCITVLTEKSYLYFPQQL